MYIKEKKAQLFGSQIVLWIYRISLIILFLFGLLIIVARYNTIAIESKPLMLDATLNKVNNYLYDHMYEDDFGIYNLPVGKYDNMLIKVTIINGKEKRKEKTAIYGNQNLKVFCEIKQKAKLRHEVYCLNKTLIFETGNVNVFLAIS